MNVSLKKTLHTAALGLCFCAISNAFCAPAFDSFREPMKLGAKSRTQPRIASSTDFEFKTRINEASKQRINFAGHYVLSSFGCGANCIMSFALDKKTGKVIWLPFTVCCWDDVKPGAMPLSFKPDSRLLIVVGSRNEEGSGFYYYELKNEKFVQLPEMQ